jgi:formylglycine-generating enzyme required for sulfatase activity
MVYIPGGAYYLGSGGTEPYAFYQYPSVSTPFQVSSENSITVGSVNGNLYYEVNTTYSGDGLGPVGDLFPKGFKGFYIMRYEISQQQYVDFLNSLTRSQQQTRTNSNVSGDLINNNFVMSGTSSMVARNGISCNRNGNGTIQPINFFCDFNENGTGNEAGDGQNIACGFLSWADGMAYFDWSGLRPMTELEFEKACRGTNIPVPNEYAWGNTITTQVSTVILNSGFPSEVVNNADIGLSNYNRDTGFGPLRCGFAATGTTNRLGAASSYYGVLNMSDNLSERCISIGTTAGRAFTGLHGDGNLSATGNGNVVNWPGISGQSARAGNYLRESSRMAVSNRNYASYTSQDRTENLGWRGVRTFE